MKPLPLDHPTVLRAAWGHDDLAQIARHEAGHAVAYTALRRGHRIDSVTIEMPAEVRGVIDGTVRFKGGLDDQEAAAELQKPVEPPPEHLREPDPGDDPIIAGVGAPLLAGTAAQYPSAAGVPLAAWAQSGGDRRSLQAALARCGIRWDLGTWCWPAWHAACQLVDERWGAVLVVAGGLLERKTLLGDEVRDLVGQAPALRNHRPEWGCSRRSSNTNE